MDNRSKRSVEPVIVAAVSGGPDSVYLLSRLVSSRKGTRVIIGHVNHGTRGIDSEGDQRFVENLGRSKELETIVFALGGNKVPPNGPSSRGIFPPGFEGKARDVRYEFLKNLAAERGGGKIAVGHTADDQVETILMRFLEGAGIAGIKGIPRENEDGVVRPILDIWKEDILEYLKKNKIPFREDKSNLDTRFERNWLRHVLIPLLVLRYGKPVKKRIFMLGERFRELDEYIGAGAQRWIRRNVKAVPLPGSRETLFSLSLRRKTYSDLPTLLRIKVLQKICFDLLRITPNERLLQAMDRTMRQGGPSSRVTTGKGWKLLNRYELSEFVPCGDREGRDGIGDSPIAGKPGLAIIEKVKVSPAQAKRFAAGGDIAYFDAAGLRTPLSVRPLRAGDRIRPFGMKGERKVKEILIDRKVPKDARWGRPVVCDSEGTILWIPGLARSFHAPVTGKTRSVVSLRLAT